jgi:hypothetical protein
MMFGMMGMMMTDYVPAESIPSDTGGDSSSDNNTDGGDGGGSDGGGFDFDVGF